MQQKSARNRRWEFSARERRAVLLFLPLAGLLIWITAEAVRPRFGDSALLLGDTLGETVGIKGDSANMADKIATPLFHFDPNVVTYEELRSLGLAKSTAAGIIKYRTAGKIFAVPEDFATCYGISDSAYSVLKPYIVIGEKYRLAWRPVADSGQAGDPSHGKKGHYQGVDKGIEKPARRSYAPDSLPAFDPNALDIKGFETLGFTHKQAQAIINFREAAGGFRTAEDFGKSYVVSDEAYERLRDRIIITPRRSRPVNGGTADDISNITPTEKPLLKPGTASLLELNLADSLSLLKVRGIGPKTASAIISYRNRLGGYHSTQQILETGIVTERNWELMREQIWTDSCAILKIDINFAPSNTIASHPYIIPRTVRKITRNRQLKGGWSTIEDMIEDNTLTKEEAAKLAPYLHFSTRPLK